MVPSTGSSGIQRSFQKPPCAYLQILLQTIHTITGLAPLHQMPVVLYHHYYLGNTTLAYTFNSGFYTFYFLLLHDIIILQHIIIYGLNMYFIENINPKCLLAGDFQLPSPSYCQNLISSLDNLDYQTDNLKTLQKATKFNKKNVHSAQL